MEIALINEDLFKENAPIKEDTIITKFIPYIIIAQKMYIRRVLGVKLYEELQAQIKAAISDPPTPLPAESQALIIEIAPALSHYAVYQGLPFHWAAIVNKGVTIRESENSGAVSINDLAQLRRWLRDDAQQLTQDLIDYLGGCAGTYPSYKPAGDCGSEGQGLDPFDSGIFIPKRK